MPFSTFRFRPGINTQATQAANEGGWSRSNLIRWWDGFAQKVGGWQRISSSVMAGICRAMHGYEDLQLIRTLLLGTDGGPQIYAGGSVLNVQLTRRISNIPQFRFIPTVGSTLVTVTDASHGAVVGDTVTFLLTVSIGGRKLSQGYTTTVVTVPNANTWTFNMPQTALTANAQATNFFNYIFSSPSKPPGMTVNDIKVLLPGHGLVVGSVYLIEQTTIANTYSPGINLYVNTPYTVAGVIDQDNFWFTYGLTGSQNDISIPLNLGNAQVSYSGNSPSSPQNWFLDNFGQFGLFCYSGSPIYYYSPPLTVRPAAQGIQSGPQINQGMFVAMPQAQIIAFGSEAVFGGAVQDPLLIRWCDAGDFNVWTASAVNQAGSFRLSKGSMIVGGLQAPQNTLIWTDTDVWQMQYQGAPLVYSFSIIGSGCGLIAPKARAVLGQSTYWMSIRGFFAMSGEGVQSMPCPVWDAVFNDLDLAQTAKTWAWSNTPFNEIWFFFASLSGGTGEIDSYVKMQNGPTGVVWDYGKLARTSGIDQSVFGPPMAADLGLLVQQHETTYDADGSALQGAYVESGFSKLGDGQQIAFVDQVIPDFKFLGTGLGYVTMTMWTKNYLGDRPEMHGPFTVTSHTDQLPFRARARFMAVRIDWGPVKGFSARMGAPDLRIAPAGRV